MKETDNKIKFQIAKFKTRNINKILKRQFFKGP